MTKQIINIGSEANDGTGDPLRTAFEKTNDNFDEVYSDISTIETDIANIENSIVNLSNNIVLISNTAFSGAYNDLTDKPDLDLYVLKNNANTDLTITARSINLTSTDDVQTLAGDEIRLYANTRIVMETEGTGNSYFWIFRTDGATTFPDGTTQETAFSGTQQDIINWNEAYGWGDHATEGYLTAVPEIINSSIVSSVNSNNIIIDSNTSIGSFEKLNGSSGSSNFFLIEGGFNTNNNYKSIFIGEQNTNELHLYNTREIVGKVGENINITTRDFAVGESGANTGIIHMTFSADSDNNLVDLFTNLHVSTSAKISFQEFGTIDFTGAQIDGLDQQNLEINSILVNEIEFTDGSTQNTAWTGTAETFTANNINTTNLDVNGSATFAGTGYINLNNDALDDTFYSGFTTDKSILSIAGADYLAGSDHGGGVTIRGGLARNGGNNGDVIISSGAGGASGTGYISLLSDHITTSGTWIGTQTMDIKGSVYGANNTLLVDGANESIPLQAIDKFVNRSLFSSNVTVTPMSANLLYFNAYQGQQAFNIATGQWTAPNTGLYRLDFVLGLTVGKVDLPLIVFLYNITASSNQLQLFNGNFTGSVLPMSGTTYLMAGQNFQFGIIQQSGNNIILDSNLTSVGIEELARLS